MTKVEKTLSIIKLLVEETIDEIKYFIKNNFKLKKVKNSNHKDEITEFIKFINLNLYNDLWLSSSVLIVIMILEEKTQASNRKIIVQQI